MWIHVLLYLFSIPITSQTSRRAYFTTLHPQCLDGLYHQPAYTILLCHCVSQTTCRQYRNINLLSIAYDYTVLGLGPDLPWEDEPSPGNLRLSTVRILTSLSLLMPAFSLLCRPLLLTVQLQPAHDAPLPPVFAYRPMASAAGFSPGHFRRTITRLVSCYAFLRW